MTTISLPVVATNAPLSTQQRIAAFQRELELSKRELLEIKQAIASADEDCAALHRDLLTEREARTNAQIERDALALKLAVWRKLGERVTQAYGDEDVIAMAEVIADVWAALKVSNTEAQS